MTEAHANPESKIEQYLGAIPCHVLVCVSAAGVVLSLSQPASSDCLLASSLSDSMHSH